MAAPPGKTERTYIHSLPHSPPLPLVPLTLRPKAVAVYYPVITVAFLVIDVKGKFLNFLYQE